MIDKDQESNIRTILWFYQKLSVMVGPEADMIKIFDGIESIKILIADASVDPVSNFRIIRLIEDNFEKYFQENRQPSEKQQKKFRELLKERVKGIKAELELIENIEKQQREIHNPRAVYFNTY